MLVYVKVCNFWLPRSGRSPPVARGRKDLLTHSYRELSAYRSAGLRAADIDDLAFVHPIVPKIAELAVDAPG